MKEEYTDAEYVNAFRQLVVPPHHMRMLQANYHAPNRTITATMMARAMVTQIIILQICTMVNLADYWPKSSVGIHFLNRLYL
jgi:hypothetical protein